MAKVGRSLLSFAVLALGLLTSHSEASTPIRACNNEQPLPLMVQVDNCLELPCNLVMGKRSDMAIQFVATKNSMDLLHVDVQITALGVRIPFTLDEDRRDICKNLLFGAYCPLYAGEDVTYHLMLDISEKQPEVPVRLEVNILDKSDGSVVSCFVTDGHIKKRWTGKKQ